MPLIDGSGTLAGAVALQGKQRRTLTRRAAGLSTLRPVSLVEEFSDRAIRGGRLTLFQARDYGWATAPISTGLIGGLTTQPGS